MEDEKKKYMRRGIIVFLCLTNVLLLGLTYCMAYSKINGHNPKIIEDKYTDTNVC